MDVSLTGQRYGVDERMNGGLYGGASPQAVLDGGVEGPAAFQELYSAIDTVRMGADGTWLARGARRLAWGWAPALGACWRAAVGPNAAALPPLQVLERYHATIHEAVAAEPAGAAPDAPSGGQAPAGEEIAAQPDEQPDL